MPSVLIAEDEPAAARYLKSLVEAEAGYRVEALAGNGQEALEQIRLRRPDLILTDIRMPVLDGLGLAARVRTEFPGLPLVIVSGHQEFEYARQALALGVVDYLLKPVDPAELGKLLHDPQDPPRGRWRLGGARDPGGDRRGDRRPGRPDPRAVPGFAGTVGRPPHPVGPVGSDGFYPRTGVSGCCPAGTRGSFLCSPMPPRCPATCSRPG